MANLWITEGTKLVKDADGNAVMGLDLDSVISTTVKDFTSGAVSHALDKKTRVVRVKSDADCHIVSGDSPAATTNDLPLEANVAEYFGVQRKGTTGRSISVIGA